jgi:hypothetical protein
MCFTLILKIKFSQNTTNLLSLISVTTCFDSVIIRPIFEPCFKVHEVTTHIFGIPKSLEINESVIIDRYCHNNYFLKIYLFSF